MLIQVFSMYGSHINLVQDFSEANICKSWFLMKSDSCNGNYTVKSGHYVTLNLKEFFTQHASSFSNPNKFFGSFYDPSLLRQN